MHPFLQNKFVRLAGLGLGLLFIIIIVFAVIAGSLNDARGLSNESTLDFNPSVTGKNFAANDSIGLDYNDAEFNSPAYPSTPSNYTSELESYETTTYNVSGLTKEFDALCESLLTLKADPNIHFKFFSQSTNNCRATMFTDVNVSEATLATLTKYPGIEFIRDTTSATRHRQQLQGRTDILQQQLASVSRSLTSAEIQFDEIAEFAKESKDPATLSQAITQKLYQVENLTQRKINLTDQLNNLYQQAADLDERLGVVEFQINVNRLHPIYPDKTSRQWESAWDELSDTYTDTLIGLTAFFGIFILWVIRGTIYLLVAIVVLRGLWKFCKLLWSKW